MKIPLSYIYRTHTEVTDEIRAADYDDSDQRYIATVALRGPEYRIDNGRVFDKLRPLVNEGTCWSFIESFKRRKDGRGAILALRRLAMGDAPTQSRKVKAYAIMDKAFWNGQSRNFTHDRLVSNLQFAYTELETLAEPVAASRKVDTYTNAIQVPKLESAKALIISETGPDGKANNFEAAHQYVQRIILTQRGGIPSEREAGNPRNISQTGTQSGNGGGNRGGGRGNGKRKLDPEKFYPRSVLAKRSKKEKDEFFNARRERKARKEQETQVAADRQHAAIVQEVTNQIAAVQVAQGADNADAASTITQGSGTGTGGTQQVPPPPANPTVQFGRRGARDRG